MSVNCKYNVFVHVNKTSHIKNNHKFCRHVGLLNEFNLNFHYQSAYNLNERATVLAKQLASKLRDHVQNNMSLFTSRKTPSISALLNSFYNYNCVCKDLEFDDICVVMKRKYCGVSYIKYLMDYTKPDMSISDMIKDLNVNKTKCVNGEYELQLYLIVFPYAGKKFLNRYFITKIPFFAMPKVNFNDNYNEMRMDEQTRQRKCYFSYDSIEWNDFDIAIYQYTQCQKFTHLGFPSPILHVYSSLIDDLFQMIEIAEQGSHVQSKNIYNNNNFYVNDHNYSVQEMTKAKETLNVWTVHYVLQHLVHYICPFFDTKPPPCYLVLPCTEYVSAIFQSWIKCYYLQYKYKYPQPHLSYSNIFKSLVYFYQLRVRVKAPPRKSIFMSEQKAKQLHKKWDDRGLIDPLIESARTMNQMSYLRAHNDPKYNFAEITQFLHYICKRYTSSKQCCHGPFNHKYHVSKSRFPFDLDIEASFGDEFGGKPPKQWYWEPKGIEFMLFLIMIILSFCHTISSNGMNKMYILLNNINRNYINIDSHDKPTSSKLVSNGWYLYYFALILLKLKNIDINSYCTHIRGQKTIDRSKIKALLVELKTAYDFFNTHGKDHKSVWNQWPQMNDHIKWIEYLANKQSDTNHDITQITKLRQLPQRFIIVAKHFSMVDKKDTCNILNVNHLDKIAIKLGLSTIKQVKKDSSYIKMLRLCKNLSSKTICCHYSCNSLCRKLRRCANCKEKYYCSRRCQKIDWKKDKTHAQKCMRKRCT